MRYSTRSEYGARALAYLAREEGNGPSSAREIAASENLSVEYVEKLLGQLKRHALVESHRGTNGGFTLAREPSAISMKLIVEALDGETFTQFCSEEQREKIACHAYEACGLKSVWNGLREVIDEYLENITLETILNEHLRLSEKAS